MQPKEIFDQVRREKRKNLKELESREVLKHYKIPLVKGEVVHTIEKATATALRPFMFEFNDEGTRANILGVLNPYYEQIKARRGVYEYLVVCDSTNNTPAVIDQNALVVNIFVKPTKVAEFLQVNMIVTKTGANFEEVVA